MSSHAYNPTGLYGRNSGEKSKMKMAKLEKLRKMVEELQEYAGLEGSELGEVCHALVYLSNYGSYVSDAFYEALYTEIESQLANFKTNCRIVGKERIEKYFEQSLEWN